MPTNLAANEIKNLTIINGSYGGGWELTSKVTAKTLVSLGLARSYNIETLEGGAGWRALEMFITDDRFQHDILIQSEPLISGSLKRMYHKGFRDLRPIALIAAEYSCLVVAYDSPYKNFSDVLSALEANPSQVPISVGGRFGTGDHITASIIFNAAKVINTANLRYSFSDGGDDATVNYLIKSEKMIGVTGYNSIIRSAVDEKKVRVIAITSLNKVDGHSSFKELGINIEHANWRGFFARKDISEDKFKTYLSALSTLSKSKEWHNVLKENGWSPFFKVGSDLHEYLVEHEKKLKMTMKDLNIIK